VPLVVLQGLGVCCNWLLLLLWQANHQVPVAVDVVHPVEHKTMCRVVKPAFRTIHTSCQPNWSRVCWCMAEQASTVLGRAHMYSAIYGFI